MNRKTLSIVAASLVVAGALGAQQPKATAKKVAPTAVAAAPAAPAATVASAAVAPTDTTHKKHAKKGSKKVAKHDSTAKHDTTHATPKKHKPS